MNWQPIETAPKDGTYILVYERGELGHSDANILMVRWYLGRWEMCVCTDVFDELLTHWIPLPDPPY